MSRAFAPGESADDEERFIIKPPVLPPGTPNYITPAGLRDLEAEQARLTAQKNALGKSFDDEQRAKMIARQLAELDALLQSVQVIDPAAQVKDSVHFGASVTLRDAKGKNQTWRIVGVNETDIDQGRISWISPLARALLEKKAGDIIPFGADHLTILSIA